MTSGIPPRSISDISIIFDKMKRKNFFYFIISLAVSCSAPSFAQKKADSLPTGKKAINKQVTLKTITDTIKKNNISDTGKPFKPHRELAKSDTAKTKIYKDTFTQNLTVLNKKAVDSTENENHIDTLINTANALKNRHLIINKLLLQNRFINIKEASAYFIEEERHRSGKEFLFYSLCVIVLILGIFKTFYNAYFKNLFRVYFNTSLRQTQLADQLVQAQLPSLILNIFFALTAGIYIWLLFNHYHPPRLISSRLLLPFCILSVAMLYFIKFCLLKFMGWVSDIQQATDNYIFAIFMINKITGIILVPVIILLAFLNPKLFPAISNISFMILGLFFLSRYIKSYGALEKKIPLNPFHFILYIIGAEIIPLIIIYKVATDYLI